MSDIRFVKDNDDFRFNDIEHTARRKPKVICEVKEHHFDEIVCLNQQTLGIAPFRIRELEIKKPEEKEPTLLQHFANRLKKRTATLQKSNKSNEKEKISEP